MRRAALHAVKTVVKKLFARRNRNYRYRRFVFLLRGLSRACFNLRPERGGVEDQPQHSPFFDGLMDGLRHGFFGETAIKYRLRT